MKILRLAIKFSQGVLISLAALAAIFTWAGITPGTLMRMSNITVPHWFWLVGGLILFGISLRDSIRRLFLATSATQNTISTPTAPPPSVTTSTLGAIPLFPATESTAQANRLTVRIVEGFFSTQLTDPSTVVILLSVRVDGSPAKVADWKLELQRGGNHWKTAYRQRMVDSVSDYSVSPRDLEIVEVKELSDYVPSYGWLLFTVSNDQPEFRDHIFGATFVLTAVEDSGEVSSVTKPPEEWLNRATRINYQGG